MLEYIDGSECIVQPFNDSYEPMRNIGLINGALACDTSDGNTYLLMINQAMDFRETCCKPGTC